MSCSCSLNCYYSHIRQRSMTFNRFDDYLTDDAIEALMEDAISESLTEETKQDLESFLNSKNDF